MSEELAQAAARLVEDARDGGVVPGVDHEPHVGQHVHHDGVIHQGCSPVQVVGDAQLYQRSLQGLGERFTPGNKT